MHGFEITCWLEERSDSQLAVDDSALYQALHRMEERDLIAGDWGVTENNRRARFYRMTTNGRAHLRAEAANLVRYASTVTSILEARAR
jgi:DNA-binding PadR family transcriptional regulator